MGFLGKLLGGPGKTSIRASFGLYLQPPTRTPRTYQIQGDPPYGNYYASLVPPLFDTPFIDRQTGNNEGVHFPVPFPPATSAPRTRIARQLGQFCPSPVRRLAIPTTASPTRST